MEFYGKIKAIVLAREGVTKMSGNPYQIHNVVVEGSESVVFEVYGTREHMEKYGLVEGAEGKFTVKTEANAYQDRWYQRMSMVDVRRDFKPLANSNPSEPKTEGQLQHEVVAGAAQAANTPTNQTAPAEAPKPNDDLPF